MGRHLPRPGFGQQGSHATNINNAGQIIGVNAGNAAVIWNGNTQAALGLLQGSGSYAWGINNAGQVAGMSDPAQASTSTGVDVTDFRVTLTTLTPGCGVAPSPPAVTG